MAQQSVGDDILFAPIRDLAERLRTRRLSPVALTEAYLDRLQKIGPRLNAVVTLMRESALREARAADEEIRAGNYRGAAPRHPVRREGSARHRRRADHLGRGAAAQTGLRLRRHRDPQASRRRRHPARQTRHGRARRLVRLQQRRRQFHRPVQDAMELRFLVGRLIVRLRRLRRRRPVRLRRRLGNFRLHHHARGLLRRVRIAAHLWPGQPIWRDGTVLDARQARADLPLRRLLRHRAHDNGRPRRQGSLHRRQAVRLARRTPRRQTEIPRRRHSRLDHRHPAGGARQLPRIGKSPWPILRHHRGRAAPRSGVRAGRQRRHQRRGGEFVPRSDRERPNQRDSHRPDEDSERGGIDDAGGRLSAGDAGALAHEKSDGRAVRQVRRPDRAARSTVAYPIARDFSESYQQLPRRPADHPRGQRRRPTRHRRPQRLRPEQPADRHSVHGQNLERSEAAEHRGCVPARDGLASTPAEFGEAIDLSVPADTQCGGRGKPLEMHVARQPVR